MPTLEEKERALLEFCQTPQDRASIQQHLQLRERKHLRERYLQPLLAKGWLEMTDPNHPNAPTQKYQTTKAGQEILAAGKGETS